MKNHFDISGSIEIREVDIAGVACNRILKILKLNEVTGPDDISNRMLKSTCNTVCVPLSEL